MRVKKWMILIFYMYLFFTFGYLSYADFKTGDAFWVGWAIPALAIGYQIFLLVTQNKGGWNSSHVVADQRVLNKIKSSLAISYIFVLIFLLVGAIGLYNGLFLFDPMTVMVAAIIWSLFVFMVSQIIQSFIN